MKYSLQTGGFYTESINGNNIPADAIELADSKYLELINGLSQGFSIDLDDDGNLVLTTLSKSATQLLQDVDRERSKRWRAGFPVQIGGVTKWFHSDEFTLTQHLGLKDKARDVLAAGGAMTDSITIAGQPVYWSTMDGSQVAITAQVAFDLVSSAGLQQALVFAASQAHKAAINAAEDLSDYDVLTNWPAVFIA